MILLQDKKTKEFLKEKYNKAKELYDNLTERRELLEKLITYIAEKQYLFLQKDSNF